LRHGQNGSLYLQRAWTDISKRSSYVVTWLFWREKNERGFIQNLKLTIAGFQIHFKISNKVASYIGEIFHTWL
jgi:hypothetical protein